MAAFGVKGIALDSAVRTGKTVPFAIKGMILPQAGATTPQLVAICGSPYRRKGISPSAAAFGPLEETGEEAAGKSMRNSAEETIDAGFPSPADNEEDPFEGFEPNARSERRE